jgi:hypothetical protein
MAMSFGVFSREHILTWNHLLSPFSFEAKGKVLELTSRQKANALIPAGIAIGASLVLDRSRTTLFVIAAGTALTTFYAVTGYFKWSLMQPPVLKRPAVDGSEKESEISPKSKGSRPVDKPGTTSSGSSHTLEDFKQKPDWLVPQQSSDSTFQGKATHLRREKERTYFASLWKSLYKGVIASGEHWAKYSDQDEQLKANKLSVEKGAPWEAFARFAQKQMQ